MISVFMSYSHKDEDLRNQLETHLTLLKREGTISTWHDRRIPAGTEIHGAIDLHIKTADVILLLISANFLASDYCYDVEMDVALRKHEDKSAIVIPVILHPCDWHSARFGKLRATPTDGRAVTMFGNQHEALAIVAKDIREAIQGRVLPGIGTTPSSPLNAEVRGMVVERSSNMRIKRKFDDHERDEFLENSYEYIARFFEGSLDELAKRNRQIKTRFKRVDGKAFTASIYEEGKRVADCSIWYGTMFGDAQSISFSNSADGPRNSFNESLTVNDDGYALYLQAMGINFSGRGRTERMMAQQGAAEYYWGMLIHPLQD